MTDLIRYEVADEIATITINRPDKLNALNPEVLARLGDAVASAGENAAARGLIITGAGEKAFVAGADIGYLAGMDAVTGREYSRLGQRVFDRIEDLGKPVIAVVNGYALGGGFELALACHLRVVSTRAKLGLPEVSLGIIPGYGGTQRLARLIGKGRALELVLSGEMIDAERAYTWGIANRVAEPQALADTARSLLEKIVRNAPIALRYALSAVHRGYELDCASGQRVESDLFGLCAATKDMKEGMAAFLEKRSPTFKGV